MTLHQRQLLDEGRASLAHEGRAVLALESQLDETFAIAASSPASVSSAERR